MRVRLVVAVSIAILGASCANAPARSDERFCGELNTHADAIRTVPTSVEEIPGLIQLYSRMGEVAPLAIEPDWRQLIVNLKTADGVDVKDPNAGQIVADVAYASQKSAQAVVVWAQQVCGLELGPAGAVAQGSELTTTTTAG